MAKLSRKFLPANADSRGARNCNTGNSRMKQISSTDPSRLSADIFRSREDPHPGQRFNEFAHLVFHRQKLRLPCFFNRLFPLPSEVRLCLLVFMFQLNHAHPNIRLIDSFGYTGNNIPLGIPNTVTIK